MANALVSTNHHVIRQISLDGRLVYVQYQGSLLDELQPNLYGIQLELLRVMKLLEWVHNLRGYITFAITKLVTFCTNPVTGARQACIRYQITVHPAWPPRIGGGMDNLTDEQYILEVSSVRPTLQCGPYADNIASCIEAFCHQVRDNVRLALGQIGSENLRLDKADDALGLLRNPEWLFVCLMGTATGRDVVLDIASLYYTVPHPVLGDRERPIGVRVVLRDWRFTLAARSLAVWERISRSEWCMINMV